MMLWVFYVCSASRRYSRGVEWWSGGFWTDAAQFRLYADDLCNDWVSP